MARKLGGGVGPKLCAEVAGVDSLALVLGSLENVLADTLHSGALEGA